MYVVYMYMYVYIYMYVCVCVYVLIYGCMYVYMHASMYYIRMYIYIYCNMFSFGYFPVVIILIAISILTPVNYPKENILHKGHSESLKSRILHLSLKLTTRYIRLFEKVLIKNPNPLHPSPSFLAAVIKTL